MVCTTLIPAVLRRVLENDAASLADELLPMLGTLPLAVRLRLANSDDAPSVGLALALRLLLGRTSGVPGATRVAARRLVETQRADGSFGGVAATAVAVRSLAEFEVRVDAVIAERDEVRGASSLAGDLESVRRAITHAAYWLDVARRGAVQWRKSAGDSVSGRGWIGDALDSAVVVWQLGACGEIEARLELDELRGMLVASGALHDPAMRAVLGAGRAEDGGWGTGGERMLPPRGGRGRRVLGRPSERAA